MNYQTYHLSLAEEGKVLAAALAIAGVVAELFYDSWAAMVLGIPILWILRRMAGRAWREKRLRTLTNQFQDAMQSVSTSLLAGYSMENAWREAEREMETLHGSDAYITCEWRQMNQAIALHTPMEQSFQEFALRSQVEDILLFSEVFSFAKRSGGNLIHIIANTTEQMKEKRKVEEEIQVLIAAKKLEQQIMDVVPLGMLAYLKLASSDYLSVLYHNIFGMLFMSICLILYVAILWFSKQILEIRI